MNEWYDCIYLHFIWWFEWLTEVLEKKRGATIDVKKWGEFESKNRSTKILTICLGEMSSNKKLGQNRTFSWRKLVKNGRKTEIRKKANESPVTWSCHVHCMEIQYQRWCNSIEIHLSLMISPIISIDQSIEQSIKESLVIVIRLTSFNQLFVIRSIILDNISLLSLINHCLILVPLVGQIVNRCIGLCRL